ncbi:ScbR family autoregulator-binding transcription factor [Streptomyces sp. NPDC001970]
MARQERAIRTRRAILEAAAAVFAERGYEAATISDVLERAEVTKGALYFHFPSKEDLARGVLDEAVTTEGVRPQSIKLQELVDAMLLIAYRLPREPMLSAALRMAVDLESRRLFGTRWPDWTELLAGLLREARERGETHPHLDETEVARIIVCAWTGVRVVTEGLPEEYDLPHEIATMFQMMLPSIAVPTVLARLEVTSERATRLVANLAEDRLKEEWDVQQDTGTVGS